MAAATFCSRLERRAIEGLVSLPSVRRGGNQREQSTINSTGADSQPFTHSQGCRSVTIRSNTFDLTGRQTRMIEILDEARTSGNPDISVALILERPETKNGRWQDTFKSNADARGSHRDRETRRNASLKRIVSQNAQPQTRFHGNTHLTAQGTTTIIATLACEMLCRETHMQERLLTVREAATITGHKGANWRASILLRKVPYHKVGRSIRIAESDLNRLIEETRVPARASR